MVIELYPHQQKAVDELSNGKILIGGVGSGKSITSLVYYWSKVCGGVVGDLSSARRYRDLYVITTAKKRDDLDWHKEAAHLGLSRDRANSVDGLGLVVDSWQNIDKYKDVKDAFFIFDEKKLEGNGAWSKAFQKIARENQWIILSATPGDNWLDYAQVFIANNFYKNITEFKNTHVEYDTWTKFPKVKKYHNVGRLVKYRNTLLVDMPYPRHTIRHIKPVSVDHDVLEMKRVVEKRWHVYEERPLKDVAELFAVMRKVANSTPSRLLKLVELTQQHSKVIVFYNFNYELDTLRSGLSGLDGYKIAEWNGHKHEPVPNSDKWIYLVQYTAGAEGWNCIETDTILFYSLTYSYKVFEQCMGRIDRLNTPFVDLWYYLLFTNSWIDNQILKKLKTKETFNEKKALKSLKMDVSFFVKPSKTGILAA